MTYGNEVIPFEDEETTDMDVEGKEKSNQVSDQPGDSISNQDNQEYHMEFADCFWLRVLLGASAIDSNLTPNPKFQLFNKFVNCIAAVVFGVELVYVIYKQIQTQLVNYVHNGVVLWVFHSVIMYTVVSSSMRKKISLLTLISEVSKEEPSSLQRVCLQHVRQVIRTDGIATFCFCFVNVVVTSINWTVIWEVVPLSSHIGYVVSLCLVHYIYSLCWFLAVPFVHVSCYVMTKKIENFKSYLEQAVAENRPVNIRHVMRWYKELYNTNKKLNDLVSPLITTSFVLIGMLIVVMMMVSSLGVAATAVGSCSSLFTARHVNPETWCHTQSRLLV